MWLVDRCACRICVHSVCQVSLKLDDFTFLLHRRPCDVTIVHTYITMTMLKPYIAQLYSQVKLITSIILLQSNVLLGNLSLLLWMTQILLQTKNTPPPPLATALWSQFPDPSQIKHPVGILEHVKAYAAIQCMAGVNISESVFLSSVLMGPSASAHENMDAHSKLIFGWHIF